MVDKIEKRCLHPECLMMNLFDGGEIMDRNDVKYDLSKKDEYLLGSRILEKYEYELIVDVVGRDDIKYDTEDIGEEKGEERRVWIREPILIITLREDESFKSFKEEMKRMIENESMKENWDILNEKLDVEGIKLDWIIDENDYNFTEMEYHTSVVNGFERRDNTKYGEDEGEFEVEMESDIQCGYRMEGMNKFDIGIHNGRGNLNKEIGEYEKNENIMKFLNNIEDILMEKIMDMIENMIIREIINK